jgi:1,4-alpha-glucan branching enzyme
VRKGRERIQTLLFVFNFTPVPRDGYRIGAPLPGTYQILINSDSKSFGGSGWGARQGVVAAEARPCHGLPFSLELSLPPLGMLVLKPRG